jgi:transposase
MGKSIQEFSSVTRVGLDLAKKIFQVHAIDANGEIVVARKLARGRLVGFFSELPRCVVAMEACSSAHHWARQLLALGFEVRPDPARSCEALCPAQQERRGRCGGDL